MWVLLFMFIVVWVSWMAPVIKLVYLSVCKMSMKEKHHDAKAKMFNIKLIFKYWILWNENLGKKMKHQFEMRHLTLECRWKHPQSGWAWDGSCHSRPQGSECTHPSSCSPDGRQVSAEKGEEVRSLPWIFSIEA